MLLTDYGMNNLIIIDDNTCREELRSFLDANSEHVKLFLSEEDYNIDLDILIDKLQSAFSDQQILFFSTSKNVIKVAVNEIKHITSDNNHVNLFLIDGSSHVLPEQLEHYKTNLENHNIIQINKDTLINISAVKKFFIQDDKIFLTGGDSFNVDNQYTQKILNTLNEIDN